MAVFGAPDPEFGERIVAAIQPAEGWAPNKAEIYAWLDNQLARFKHPKIIDFHQTLPRGDSEKNFNPACANPIGTARAAASEAPVCRRKTPATRIGCF